MKTGIQSKSRDLGEIFKLRHDSDAVVAPTGILSKGRDLAEIFAPYTGGKKAEPVGIQSASRDLSEIFAPRES